MSWKINSAIHVGKDHEFKKINLQDYVSIHEDKRAIIGIICDGCSEGKYSETGAALIGTYMTRLLSFLAERVWNYDDGKLLKKIILDDLLLFFNNLLSNVKLNMNLYPRESVQFVKDHLLATLVFCVILKEQKQILIGNSGDGVVIKEGAGLETEVFKKNQNDKPHYLAYQLIPKQFLEKEPSELDSITIEHFSIGALDKVIIGSDGLEPFLEKHSVDELYGKEGRQLQRLINVTQIKERIFFDDISLITFEKDNLVILT